MSPFPSAQLAVAKSRCAAVVLLPVPGYSRECAQEQGWGFIADNDNVRLPQPPPFSLRWSPDAPRTDLTAGVYHLPSLYPS